MRRDTNWMGMLHERVLECLHEYGPVEVSEFQRRCSLSASEAEIDDAVGDLISAWLVECRDGEPELTPDGERYLAGELRPEEPSATA
jgi:hypothetical protein